MFLWHEYIILVVYILIILGIGAYFSKKGSENVDEYFLGGKKLPWWVLGISFMTSNLDLSGTMVIASFFAMAGFKGFLVEMRGGTALALAMFMIFMAKWHRRSGAMTVAEWMEMRFGSGAAGKAARLVSAISIVVLVIGMMTYFCVGFGKFLSLYLPWDPNVCTIVFTAVATLHILFSGLYGVAFTDVIQGFMILFVVVYISILAFSTAGEMGPITAAWEAQGQPDMIWEQWSSVSPAWTMVFPPGYEAYNAIGFLLIFWVLRMLLEGFGGPLIPYASQRFFAARDEREASLTTATSLGLFVIRWPLVIGVAVLGLSLGADMPADPEHIFPVVLGHYFPVGIRAVIVSCMIAAAMSTFDSTVNAGGAYVVNDIYRRFINPEASPTRLMRLSWIATIGLTILAILFSSMIDSINTIWAWLSMGLFGGMVVPLIMRWYWERFNGWGYAAGTIVGIFTAIAVSIASSLLSRDNPNAAISEAIQLATTLVTSLAACVIATLVTGKPDVEATHRFYARTRPFGYWPKAKAQLSTEVQAFIAQENRRDLFSIPFALGFFFFLFLCPMYMVIHDWTMTGATVLIAAACAVVLYFSWFKHLGEQPPQNAS